MPVMRTSRSPIGSGAGGPVDLLFIGGFLSHLEIGVELALAQRFWERLGSFARIV